MRSAKPGPRERAGPVRKCGLRSKRPASPRIPGGDTVRPRTGRRAARRGAGRAAGGHHGRERDRELVQELRVRTGQMDGDGARPRVRFDATRQVAATTRGHASPRADDARVQPRQLLIRGEVARGLQEALHRAPEVGRTDRPAVGIAQSATQREDVAVAVATRRRRRRRQRPDDRRARRTLDTSVGDQAVVGERVEAERRPANIARGSSQSSRSDGLGELGTSTRSVPPRCAACGASAAAHTEPPATAIAAGLLPVFSGSTTRGPSGSTWTTVPSSPPATQTAPSPTATAVGSLPDGAAPGHRVALGIDAREVPTWRLTTHTAPSPTATALGRCRPGSPAPRGRCAGRSG